METGRMSQVRTAILETGPSQWLSELLTPDGIRRFATELAGRKARRRTWDGLGEEMTRAGWFDG